jgi:hypothetical protein
MSGPRQITKDTTDEEMEVLLDFYDALLKEQGINLKREQVLVDMRRRREDLRGEANEAQG